MLLALWPLFIVHAQHVEQLDVQSDITQRARIAHVQQRDRRKQALQASQLEESLDGTSTVPAAGSPALGESIPASLDAWRSTAAIIPVHDAGIQLTMDTNAAALVSGDAADRRATLDEALGQAREDDEMAMILIMMGMEYDYHT